MLDSLAPSDVTTDAALPPAERSTRMVPVLRPDVPLRSLANPPLIALGLAVLFLLALLVAVVIGSDAETASADEAGAAVAVDAQAGVVGPPG